MAPTVNKHRTYKSYRHEEVVGSNRPCKQGPGVHPEHRDRKTKGCQDLLAG